METFQINEDETVKRARQALTYPPDFGWWGREEMFHSWGWAGHDYIVNSGDLLNESNWFVISAELQERYPDDFEVVGVNHWAVGPMDRLTVRILIDPDGKIEWDNITDAFKASMEWVDELEVYPVADESDFSEREYEQQIKDVTYEVGRFSDFLFIEDEEEFACDLISKLELWYESLPTEDEILEHGWEKGLCRFDEVDFWVEWGDEHGKTMFWNHRTDLGGKYQQVPGQTEIDFQTKIELP